MAYPGHCRGFFSSRCDKKNGGIGYADGMPPPTLGSRVVAGVVPTRVVASSATPMVCRQRPSAAESLQELTPVVSELQLELSGSLPFLRYPL